MKRYIRPEMTVIEIGNHFPIATSNTDTDLPVEDEKYADDSPVLSRKYDVWEMW